jgi:hypothetical protein
VGERVMRGVRRSRLMFTCDRVRILRANLKPAIDSRKERS